MSSCFFKLLLYSHHALPSLFHSVLFPSHNNINARNQTLYLFLFSIVFNHVMPLIIFKFFSSMIVTVFVFSLWYDLLINKFVRNLNNSFHFFCLYLLAIANRTFFFFNWSLYQSKVHEISEVLFYNFSVEI